MSKKSVYLLTGFLGSGKTSLLKELLKIFPPRKVAIVVNEFGKAGVDGTLLSDAGYQVTEIDNGSIFCSCQLPAFERALAHLQDLEIDAIVVEASGLSDPTHVKRILEMPDFRDKLAYAGTICLVDAKRFHKYVSTALVSEKQVMISDSFVINKADLVTDEELQVAVDKLLSLRPDADYRITSFGRIDREIFDRLDEALAKRVDEPSEEKAFVAPRKDLSLRKLALKIDGSQTKADLESLLEDFAHQTFRIKGFVQLADGGWLVDSVGELVHVEPYLEAGDENVLNILYNSSLSAKDAIQKAIAKANSFQNALLA